MKWLDQSVVFLTAVLLMGAVVAQESDVDNSTTTVHPHDGEELPAVTEANTTITNKLYR